MCVLKLIMPYNNGNFDKKFQPYILNSSREIDISQSLKDWRKDWWTDWLTDMVKYRVATTNPTLDHQPASCLASH